jgi:protein-disulfide isomerase
MFAIGRQAGLTDAEMDTCIKDQASAEALVAEFQKNFTADGIEGTPTFMLNGTKFSNMDYAEFSAALDKLLPI